MPVVCLELHPAGEVREVEAGAERGIGAGEDHRVDVVGGFALGEARAERLDQLGVERVARSPVG